MKKVLVADDNIIAAEIITMFLESFFECDVVRCTSGNEAISIIESDSVQFDLIISDYNMPDGNGGDLYKYKLSKSLETPFLLVTAEQESDLNEFDFKSDKNLYCQIKPFRNEELTNIFKKIFGTKRELLDNKYIPVNIDMFTKYKDIKFDVFIKLTDEKIIKISTSDEIVPIDQILRYKEKGLKFVHLLENDFSSFIDSTLDKLDEGLSSKKMDTTQKIEFQVDSIEAISEQMVQFGVSKRAVEVSKQAVQSTVDNIKSNKSMASLLSKILKNKNYRYELSILTGYIAAAQATKTDWADAKSIEKLVFAAYFQDISLSKDDLSKIIDSNSEEFKSLNKMDRTEILDHPYKAIEALDKAEELSSDIKNIIAQQHEKPDGSGFPRGLNHLNTAPLSCVFIIAHKFSDHILQSGVSKESLLEIIQILKSDYDRGNYKKPLKAFFEVFKNL